MDDDDDVDDADYDVDNGGDIDDADDKDEKTFFGGLIDFFLIDCPPQRFEKENDEDDDD